MTPTVSEIRDQIISDIESAMGTSTPLMKKAAWRILAAALAGAMSLLYRFAEWVRRQIFTQTMDSESLDLRAAEYGMSRTPSKKWQGTITITGEDSTIVPAGTLFQYSGLVYATAAAETISGGSVTATVESLEAGEVADRADSDELEIVTPQTGVDKIATVTSTILTAEDAETDSAFRERILLRQQRPPQGGSAADFIAWCLEVSGVVKAFAFRTDDGEVTVYPLVGTGESDRIPDGPKLTEVEGYVGDTSRCPLTCDVVAAAPDVTTFNVSVTSLNPDSTAVRTAVEAALETYMLSRFPRQYPDEVNPTDMVSLAEMYKVAFDAGGQQIVMTFSEDGVGTPLTGYTLDDGELALLGTITWPT